MRTWRVAGKLASLRSTMPIAAAVTLAVVAGTAPALAQARAWDWGGERRVVASSGKQSLRFDSNLKVGQIFVSFSDRRLYFVVRRGQAYAYPIAIPRQQDDWQGVMKVSNKRVKPSWRPTPSMLRENPRLPTYVPGGHPRNPMGERALYLGSSAYRIHGTDSPWTIGLPVSRGCIRMYNNDVVDLYDRVNMGAKVTVTWDSFRDGYRTPNSAKPYPRRAPAGSYYNAYTYDGRAFGRVSHRGRYGVGRVVR